jgi:rRNA maturation protein Nop10
MDFDYFLEDTGCSCPDCSEDKKNKCRHVYEYVYAEICPDCGGYTHEPDMQLQIQLSRQYYAEGKHLKYKCDHCGGTLRVWWDI